MLTPTQIKKNVNTNHRLHLQHYYNFLYKMLETYYLNNNTENYIKYRKMFAYHLIDIIKSDLLTKKEKLELLESNQILTIEKQSGGYYSLYNNLSAYRYFQSRDTSLKGILQSAKTFLEKCLEKEFNVF